MAAVIVDLVPLQLHRKIKNKKFNSYFSFSSIRSVRRLLVTAIVVPS
jgi:hypothetical protein